MKDPFSLRDRVIIVTGGLGQLGRQFSSAFVQAGAHVVIWDVLSEEDGRTRLEDDKVSYIQADVTDKSSLEHGLEKIVREFGVPFGLVNNAALDSPPHAPAEENGPFETYPESSFDRVLDVNVKGVFLASQVVGSAMAKERRGSIVNIGSIYGLVAPDQSLYAYREQAGQRFTKPVAYSVSKSALLNLTRYLATYWALQGVRVNTLTLAGVFNDQDESFLKGYCAKMPMGRMAHPDEYNGAAVFLMSDASSYMTGSNLVIDGGWTAW